MYQILFAFLLTGWVRQSVCKVYLKTQLTALVRGSEVVIASGWQTGVVWRRYKHTIDFSSLPPQYSGETRACACNWTRTTTRAAPVNNSSPSFFVSTYSCTLSRYSACKKWERSWKTPECLLNVCNIASLIEELRFATHLVDCTWWLPLLTCSFQGHAVAQLVEALRYKPEGRGFDSRWCQWIFSLT